MTQTTTTADSSGTFPLASLVKDAGYVAVGLGVIAFQRAQVRRRELEQQVGSQLNGLDDIRKMLEERFEALSAQLDELRKLVPEQATEAIENVRGVAKDATGQLLDLVKPLRQSA